MGDPACTRSVGTRVMAKVGRYECHLTDLVPLFVCAPQTVGAQAMKTLGRPNSRAYGTVLPSRDVREDQLPRIAYLEQGPA